jgi:integrase
MICGVGAILLGDFLESVYLPTRIQLSADRLRHLAGTIVQLEQFAGRRIFVKDFSEVLIRDYLTWLRSTGRAAETVNSRRADLLALWRCAWDEELVPDPPRSRKVRRLTSPRRIPEAWSSGQVRAILNACSQAPGRICGIPASLWWRSLIGVAYDTGERRGAILATPTKDLLLDHSAVVFRQTKTGAERFCRLDSSTVEFCRAIYDPCRPLMWPWHGEIDSLNDRLETILKRAGVPWGRNRGGVFSKFRKTSGTLVEANGGRGNEHIGNTRKVFEAHYLDPRFLDRSQLDKLPRP